jgi:hypothetical protein
MILQGNLSIDPLVDKYQQGMQSSLNFLQMRWFQQGKEDRLWHQVWKSKFLQGTVSIDRLVGRYQGGMQNSLYFLQVRLFQQGKQDSLWNQLH